MFKYFETNILFNTNVNHNIKMIKSTQILQTDCMRKKNFKNCII